jgi:hypothetical protein
MNSLQVGRARYPAVDNSYGYQSLTWVRNLGKGTSGKVASATTGGLLFVERLKESAGERAFESGIA